MVNKNILVTGGAGFIGSHLVDYLVTEKNNVTVIDNLSSGRLDNLSTLMSSIRFFEIDLLSEQINSILKESHFDFIFHLAANAYVPPSVENPVYDFNNTLLTTFNLLEFIRKNKYVTVFIAISSAAIYGSPNKMPIFEHFTPDPISPYGVSKLALENYVRVFANLYGIKCASLRLFSVYGPRQTKQIVYDFMVKLKNNPVAMEIIGDGSQMRDIIFVKDVVQALTLIATKGELKGEWYNVANGKGHTTLELAKIMCELLSVHPKFKFTGKVRAGDADKWIANIDKIKSLGYSINYPLHEGLQETIKWFQDN